MDDAAALPPRSRVPLETETLERIANPISEKAAREELERRAREAANAEKELALKRTFAERTAYAALAELKAELGALSKASEENAAAEDRHWRMALRGVL